MFVRRTAGICNIDSFNRTLNPSVPLKESDFVQVDKKHILTDPRKRQNEHERRWQVLCRSMKYGSIVARGLWGTFGFSGDIGLGENADLLVSWCKALAHDDLEEEVSCPYMLCGHMVSCCVYM